MEILIIGTGANLEEARLKFGETHRYKSVVNHSEARKHFTSSDVVFDFVIEEAPHQSKVYSGHHSLVIFFNTATFRLSSLELAGSVFGFCGMPTFLNREILEVSVVKEEDRSKLKTVCEELKTKYEVVADRVGFVTPRVICMIINEAYFTVQDGTATREDIDKAMKLGTNYPWGPFEWCSRIGINNVCQLLDAMYADTQDARYKICELLKKEQ